MNPKIKTSDHNIEILQSLGYQKLSNTSIFVNDDNFILSPAVAENTNGRYWFDLREVNLNRVKVSSDPLLLVRIVPDQFILEKIKNLSVLLSDDVMDNRPNSGNVWGIHIDLKASSNSALMYNIKNKGVKITTKLLKKTEISEAVNTVKKDI